MYLDVLLLRNQAMRHRCHAMLLIAMLFVITYLMVGDVKLRLVVVETLEQRQSAYR